VRAIALALEALRKVDRYGVRSGSQYAGFKALPPGDFAAAMTPELAAATEMMIQGALQQWLAELVQVEAVKVQSIDSTLHILVRYIVRRTQERRTSEFRRAMS